MRNVLLMVVSLTVWGAPMADNTDQALADELQAFLNVYAEAYNRQDYETLLTMWDKDGP